MGDSSPDTVDYTEWETVIPAVLGLTAAAILAVSACFCARRLRQQNKKAGHEAAFSFQPPRPPKAVRSPSGQPPQYLKKNSPSPTTIKPPLGTLSPPEHTISMQKYTEENEMVPKDTLNGCKTPETETPQNEIVDGGDVEYGKLGTLVFKLNFITERSALVVSVVRCRGLKKPPNPERTTDGANGKIQNGLDPYVKVQLLPEKQHKVKTRVVRNTKNPIYDEDFTFYGLTLEDLMSMSLHFIVLSFDRYSRDDVIGEVVCHLANVDVQQIVNNQIALTHEIQPRSHKIKSQGRGELLVSLCWQPAAARLTVVMLKARNLPRMDPTNLADPYIKMYLLYNGHRIAKKKTHVKKRTLSPVFNESFAFEIPIKEGAGVTLDGISLEIMLLDYDRVTKNEVIGRLEIGANTNLDSALNHWKEVCNSPRRNIADWHKLKE